MKNHSRLKIAIGFAATAIWSITLGFASFPIPEIEEWPPREVRVADNPGTDHTPTIPNWKLSDPGHKDILVNIPISFFDKRMAGNNLPGIKYFRTFGVDFKKPKVDGLYQYADDALVQQFIEYTVEHDKEVIWTLNMTSRTLETELAYVKDLIEQGLNITGFEYGGEFYLPKYARADFSKKGVVEKVDAKIYTEMLKVWLPAFLDVLPLSEGDHIIIGASHNNSGNMRDNYRSDWNKQVAAFLKRTYPDIIDDLSWSFHLYAGRKAEASNKGEEDIVDMVDFAFMQEFPSEMKIYVTESGYNLTAFTAAELKNARKFWAVLYKTLRPNDVFGVHILLNKGKRPNQYALIDRTGSLTPVGQQFSQWMENREAEDIPDTRDNDTGDRNPTGGAGMAATLVRISDSKTLFSHVQSLSFSDGSNHKSKTCRLFGKPKFSSADIGKTKRQLRN